MQKDVNCFYHSLGENENVFELMLKIIKDGAILSKNKQKKII